MAWQERYDELLDRPSMQRPRWTRWAGETTWITLNHGRGEQRLVFFGDFVHYIPAKTLANGALCIVDTRRRTQ